MIVAVISECLLEFGGYGVALYKVLFIDVCVFFKYFFGLFMALLKVQLKI